jgi:precorrin-6Y C5,15-methyltransferase (decarboxylating)
MRRASDWPPAELVIGAGRTLALVRPWLSATAMIRDMDGALGELPDWILSARAAGQRVAVLATGDPLCHGIASWLSGRSSGVTTWTSCRTCRRCNWPLPASRRPGRTSGSPRATPRRCRRMVCRRDACARPVSAAAGDCHAPARRAVHQPENNPARLARALITAGYGDEARLSVACRLQLPDERCLPICRGRSRSHEPFPNRTSCSSNARRHFPVDRLSASKTSNTGSASPEKGLITKQEARALSLAKLPHPASRGGLGHRRRSGSVGLEAARLAPHGHVWAIEKNAADAANARANAGALADRQLHPGRRQGAGRARHLARPGRRLHRRLGRRTRRADRRVLARLKAGGRLVMNFVTLENLATATAALSERHAVWDLVQLQASRSQPILDMHRLAAQNPIWVVTARRSEDCLPRERM